MKKLLSILSLLFVVQSAFAQATKNIGKLMGKVVEKQNNSPVSSTTVRIMKVETNKETGVAKEILLYSKVALTNGDFSFDDLPIMQPLVLRVASIGYDAYISKPIIISKPPFDMDLGNIAIVRNVENLKEVEVMASKQFMELGVDKKVFNVATMIATAGQTAVEVVKQIPTLNVDVDGNVSLRNASPTIYIDNRPTTLTLDQIPADLIDRVEVLTNPGAKYDASGASTGILNIVLKRNRKLGYNGGVSVGADARGSLNAGGDLSVRQGKFNISARGMFRGRKGNSTSVLDRNILANDLGIHQETQRNRDGFFRFANLGMDYFMDNRNTFSLTGTYVAGTFKDNSTQTVDSLKNDVLMSYNKISSLPERRFEHYGTALSFRHNFETPNHYISFDANYNLSSFGGNSLVTTERFEPVIGANPLQRPTIYQLNDSRGRTKSFIAQLDYEKEMDNKDKFTAGVKTTVTHIENRNNVQVDSVDNGNSYIVLPQSYSDYALTDKVYAAYLSYSGTIKKRLSYQLGLRAESSQYEGMNTAYAGTKTHFPINYPISLFPSLALTCELPHNQDLQFNFSRKINRPNFFQLLPVVDYADPYNIRAGNPNLKPEFMYNAEISYNKSYNKTANFLATAYLKKGTNLVVSTQRIDSSINPSPITTYENASSSITYGLELTNKADIAKIWEMTLSLSAYHATINSTGFSNEGFSWFAKVNNAFKLPKSYSVQLSAAYQGKSILPVNDKIRVSQDPGGGGNLGTAQGYILPSYSMDLSAKKTWMFKSGNSLALTASINDILASERRRVYTATNFMTQTSSSIREPRVVRLTLSYRFGKMDISIFKRKSKGVTDDGRTSSGDM